MAAMQPCVHALPMLRAEDVDFGFARSSGSGGQNVNKVSTKVDMRLDLGKATWIPFEIREQIRVSVRERGNERMAGVGLRASVDRQSFSADAIRRRRTG